MISQELKKRYNAFWENDAIDRFLTFIYVEHQFPMPEIDEMTEEQYTVKKWTDIDYRVDLELKRIENTNYYCDGFPRVFTNFGPGSLSACIGGNFVPAKDTIWFDTDPMIKDWDNYPEIKFYEDSEMNKLTLDFMEKLMKKSNGRCHTSTSDIGGTYDILASLRGSQELLFDLYDYPEKVKEAVSKIQPIWKKVFLEQCQLISKYEEGFTSWMPIWCNGTYSPLQCDFSAMMSPDMFEEFVLPDLIYQTEYMDKSVYHLDGPGELPHVDHLLSIPRLSAIQWMPGAGQPDVAEECWFELYQKIQAAGKGLVMYVDKPELLENMFNHISPKGVWTIVGCRDDYTGKQIEEMIIKKGLKG